MLLDGNVGIIIVVNVNGGWMERWMKLVFLSPPHYHHPPATNQSKVVVYSPRLYVHMHM